MDGSLATIHTVLSRPVQALLAFCGHVDNILRPQCRRPLRVARPITTTGLGVSDLPREKQRQVGPRFTILRKACLSSLLRVVSCLSVERSTVSMILKDTKHGPGGLGEFPEGARSVGQLERHYYWRIVSGWLMAGRSLGGRAVLNNG